jgi:hypothetical protein
MDMVGHQAVRVHGAAFILRQPSEVMQEERAIFVIDEAGSAIVAALDSVHGHAGNHDPGTSGHLQATAPARRR